MPSFSSVIVLALAALTSFSTAHPGHDHKAEASKRKAFLERSPNFQQRCASAFDSRGISKMAVERRRGLVEGMRRDKGLSTKGSYKKSRDLASVLATDHNQTDDYCGITFETPQDYFFGDNSSYVLQPEFTLAEGPYYVQGEIIRKNGIENLTGVDMIFDLQLIDVNTCEPLPNHWVEFWQANQTGVYSGTVGNGNGNPNDTNNLNNTWLRAIQPTDNDGVVQVELLFPGHYAPRATHTHILIHTGGHILPNNTFAGGNVTHVGQIFFDQQLIYDVDTIYPYTLNPNAIKLNADDYVLAIEANTTDPVANYVYVGDDLKDGLVVWVTVGINPNDVYTVDPAAFWTADGGVENPIQPVAGP